jgi:hypothetical protein
LTLTLPFPVPVAPAVTEIHDVDVVAVHAQPLAAVTATLVVSPAAGAVRLVGLMAYVHPAAACVTVTVCPAIVSVPVRPEVAVLAVAANDTEPDPAAGPADVIVSQLAFATAVHVHVVPAVTVTEPVDAAEASDADRADSSGAQGADVANGFDNSLVDDPPGPTARTLA